MTTKKEFEKIRKEIFKRRRRTRSQKKLLNYRMKWRSKIKLYIFFGVDDPSILWLLSGSFLILIYAENMIMIGRSRNRREKMMGFEIGNSKLIEFYIERISLDRQTTKSETAKEKSAVTMNIETSKKPNTIQLRRSSSRLILRNSIMQSKSHVLDNLVNFITQFS
jgi:hypothetical protein